MSAGTKEPRLHIRYSDFTIPDKVEIEANLIGLKKNAWVKEAINEKLARDTKKRLLEKERLIGELETRKLVQLIAGPEQTGETKTYVAKYLQKIDDHVAAE